MKTAISDNPKRVAESVQILIKGSITAFKTGLNSASLSSRGTNEASKILTISTLNNGY